MVYSRFYNAESLPFNKSETLRYFGYKIGSTPSLEVQSLFDECVREADLACSYKVCYAEFEIFKEKDGKTLNLDFTKTSSQALSLNLNGCHKVVAFAATIGVGIDRLITRYSSLYPGKAYAFQAIGAERIETLCNAFNSDIKREYQARGEYTRPRFSCGYGDFPLEKQRDFLTALDCNRKIGLTLNDSLSMSPSKSVTAIIGIANTPHNREENYNNSCNGCNDCSDIHCSFKK